MGRKRTTLRDFLRWADKTYRDFLINQQGMTPEEADAFMERQAEYVKNVGRSVGIGLARASLSSRRSNRADGHPPKRESSTWRDRCGSCCGRRWCGP